MTRRFQIWPAWSGGRRWRPRTALALGLGLALLSGCASSPPTPVAVEIDVAESIAGARYVAYWLDVELSAVRNPDEVTQEEMDRLRASAARLAAEAELLEESLEQATLDRVAGRSSEFHEQGRRKARELENRTLEVRAQWEAFSRRRAEEDLAEAG